MYLNSCHHVYSRTVASGTFVLLFAAGTFVLLFAAGLTCDGWVSCPGGHVPEFVSPCVFTDCCKWYICAPVCSWTDM